MSDNSSWLKKTGPYGRITLRRCGPAPTLSNNSLSLQHVDDDLSFKRPPPRKSCLMNVDRRKLIPVPKQKAKFSVRPSIAGRPSLKPPPKESERPVGRLSLKPRQSILPLRPKVTHQLNPAYASKLLVGSTPQPQPSATPMQVSSTPREPPHSILRSGRRSGNASAAAKRVNFDGLEGVEPLQISEIEPSNESHQEIPSKVDAATDTDDIPPADSFDAKNMSEMMQIVKSLCNDMQSFLSRFGSLMPPSVVTELGRQRPVHLKPIFLENLDDIPENSENLTPSSNEVTENGPQSFTTMNDQEKDAAAGSAQTEIKLEPVRSVSKVTTDCIVGLTKLKVGLTAVSDELTEHNYHLTCKKAKNDNSPSDKAQLEENDTKEVIFTMPEVGLSSAPVERTPIKARRSARLFGAASPARLLKDGHRCTRKNCC